MECVFSTDMEVVWNIFEVKNKNSYQGDKEH